MNLQDLIAELEAADEGSKDWDATIHCVLNGSWYPYAQTVAEPVTTSIDAAIELCEQLLPGWSWAVSVSTFRNKAYGDVMNPGKMRRDAVTGETTPALALTIAVLKAHEAQQ